MIGQVIASQQLDRLRHLPKSMRTKIRTGLFDSWRFWATIGVIHLLLHRWYASYRAYTRALNIYLALSAEERKYDEGWIYHLRCWHARAALRIRRLDEAAEDLSVAGEALRGRPDISPMLLALAQGRLAQENDVGFQHFCDQALAVAAKAKLVMTEQDIRLIMAGADF